MHLSESGKMFGLIVSVNGELQKKKVWTISSHPGMLASTEGESRSSEREDDGCYY